MKRIYIVLLALTVGAANLQAQTYPVLVNVVVPPPVSPILSDYYAPSMRDRLIVSLHNRDLNQPTLRIRLRITVTNNGTTVAQSKPNLQMLPIDLYAGFPLRLSGSELADCFSPNNMTVNLTNGRFNPGSLQFTVEVFDAYTNQRLSNPASAFLFLHNPKPPLLNVPLQAARIPYNNGMPQFQLSWTPRNDGVAPVHYELMVRELSDTVAPPQAAFNYAPARFSQVVQGVSAYNYTLMDMPLQAAKRYGWCVRAFVPDGIDEINAFENNGYSEIRYFTIGEDCQPPLFFDAYAPDNRSMVVEWTPQVLHKAAVVDYRRYDEENWTSVPVNNPMQDTLLIERLTPGKTYLYRVGGVCSNAPFYPPYHKEITVPVADSSVLANCGEPPVPFVITNFEPIASLKAGDMLTINTAKVHLLSVTGGNGVFSGEAGVVTKFMALAEVRIRVTFENIKVNTDKQIFQGKLVSVYDPNAPFIGDFGQAVHGGGVNGISNNLPAPDYLIDFTIPSVEAFSFNCENADLDCEIIITGSNGETFVIAAGRNNLGYPEIPIVIQDADGNLYQIDDENTEVDENGNPIPPPKLKASYLGKVGAPYGENDMAVDRIHTNIGRVDFFPVSGKENTFDRWKSEYQGAPEVRQAYLASLSSGANSYDRYYPPYQLVPTNGTAQVKAQLSLTEFGQNFVHEDSVFFVTPTGLRYHAVYEQPTKTYTITLSGAEDRTVTEVYAIAKRHPSDQSGDLKNYYTLGKLGLANYNTNHNLKLVLVNIDGQINAATAREKLNQIYAPLGFSWEVSEDNGFDAGNAVSADSLQFTGSSWLSQYTEGMKRLHAKYRDYKGENFDESANYVFVMKNAGVSNLAGDMPRRSQFGYIFTDALGDVYRTLAHELGHGKFTLMHPIDGAYGSLKDLPNLMNTALINDTLAKWQWDILHDPAWLVIFDKDEEGMVNTSVHIALTPSGDLIDNFYLVLNGKEQSVNVSLGVSDRPYTITYIIYNHNAYEWNSNAKAYMNNGSKIFVKKDTGKPTKVNLFKRVGDECQYYYTVVDWTQTDEQTSDVLQTIASKISDNTQWIIYPYTARDMACDNNFINSVLANDRLECSAEQLANGINLLKANLTATDAEHLVNVVNSVCLSAISALNYDEKIILFTVIAKQQTLKTESELAVLRLMNALRSTDYKDFYQLLELNNNELIKHLIEEMNDVSIFFWKNEEYYTNFIGALITLFNENSESVADRWITSEDDFVQQVINLNSVQYERDLSSFTQPYETKKRNEGEYNSTTGNITLYDVYTTYVYYDEMVSQTEEKEKLSEISPLTPVIIIPDEDKIPLVQAALDGYDFGNGAYMVPAVFLKYNADKIRNDYIEKGIVTTLDVATIFASATKVHWVRRVWALMEVAGAAGNIAVNTQTIDPNSDLGKAVNAFNIGMGVIGFNNVRKGVMNYAKELSETTKELLSKNQSLKNLITAKYLDWRITLYNIDELTEAEKQLLSKQIQVWRALDINSATVNNINDFWARIPDNFVNKIQDAFDGVPSVVKYATKDMELYRHVSIDGKEISYWFSRTMESPEDARRLLALPKTNTAEYIVKVKVKEGTPYIEGKVASQVHDMTDFGTYATGGGNQLYFLNEHLLEITFIEKIVNPLK